MTNSLAWQEDARCAVDDEDILNIFFSDEDDEVDNTEIAKIICASCPVRRSCLQYALNGEERFGVWGGSDEVSRRWALSIDQYGKPIQRVRAMYCPNPDCGSKDLSDTESTRSRTKIMCNECGLTWWSRKISTIIAVTEEDIQDVLDEED